MVDLFGGFFEDASLDRLQDLRVLLCTQLALVYIQLVQAVCRHDF